MYNYVCNYKNCRYPSIFNKYCTKHYNIFFNNKALIIQKNYKRYKNNKIIKKVKNHISMREINKPISVLLSLTSKITNNSELINSRIITGATIKSILLV